VTHPTLVIADDEEAICFALARAARRAGLDPLVAADGRRAVALAAAAEVLVAAVLDVRMPGLGGVEAGLAIRAARSAVPVALMTAFADLPPTGLLAPDRVFRKPFDLGAFAAWLAALRTTAAGAA
jgi:two-component system, cell cycle sensor histidine kinase and response regulator CckA